MVTAVRCADNDLFQFIALVYFILYILYITAYRLRRYYLHWNVHFTLANAV
jgi:NADH:ubiquinone oxidoreductase subunit 3 (subunit A)